MHYSYLFVRSLCMAFNMCFNKKSDQYINRPKKPELKLYHLTIDRFEGDYAVCERADGAENVNIPRTSIDARAGEGAVIYFCKKHGHYVFDEDMTARRSAYIKELAKNIWE